MCAICMRYPCDSRCPNAEEPEPLCHCKYCKEGIYEGDEYAEIDGDYYHEDCLSDVAVKLLLEMCDTRIKEAREEDFRWM